MDLSLLLTNLLYGVTIGSALILIASGLSLTFGVMGVLNFAHGGLCMLGAYFGYTLVQITGSFWLSLFLAPMIVAGVGVLMEAFTIRPLYGLNPLYQLLLTVGLAMVIANTVLLTWGGDQLSINLPAYFKGYVHFWGLDYPRFRLFVLLFSAAIATILWITISRTKWGIVVRAGMHDLETVNAFGINIYRVFTIVFAIGAGLAALAGVIIGSMRAINPEMDFELLTSALLVIVIGGMGSFRGAVVGSLLLGVTDAFGAQFFTGAAKFTVWVLMVLVLLFRPEGLLKED
ncbi:MAG: branched-chain amino acid ABC transporter permease [Deltaproteobacteria bacterium]|nr:branched-chain amino acid ABC transporter permease [Deltaproteobacteria bacterium]